MSEDATHLKNNLFCTLPTRSTKLKWHYSPPCVVLTGLALDCSELVIVQVTRDGLLVSVELILFGTTCSISFVAGLPFTDSRIDEVLMLVNMISFVSIWGGELGVVVVVNTGFF